MDIDPRLPRGVVAFMQKAHGGQERKHGTPYWEHPHTVACILLDAWPDAPQWSIDAALLHDVLEQTAVSFRQIRERFGETTADAVDLLTIPPGRPKDLVAYYKRLSGADIGIRCIKLADRIHNLQQLPLSKDTAFMQRYIAQTEAYLLDLVTQQEADAFAPARVLREQLHALFRQRKNTLQSG